MPRTGIASIVLPGGTTSHRFFHLPIDLKDVPFLKEHNKLRLKKKIYVIIYDETSMIPKEALQLIDHSLQDVMN